MVDGPEIDPLGHRATKIARARLALGAELERRLADEEFVDVGVDALARAAGVSRATFFNYFASKDAVLDFVCTGYVYREQAELAELGLRGVAAIEHVFAWHGAAVARSPRAFARLLGAIGPNRRGFPLLTLAERSLLRDGRPWDGEILSYGDLFRRELAYARRRGQLAVPGTDFEVAHFLGALLTGASAIGHSQPGLDWEALYRGHVRRALRLPVEATTRRTRRRR